MEPNCIGKRGFFRGKRCLRSLYLDVSGDDRQVSHVSVYQPNAEKDALLKIAMEGHCDAPDAASERDSGRRQKADRTMQLIVARTPVISNATFCFRGMSCMVDILIRTEETFVAKTVCMSASLKGNHMEDAALQLFLMSSCGIQVQDIVFLYPNTSYVFEGNMQPGLLFQETSLYREALKRQDEVQLHAERIAEALVKPAVPDAEQGPHCHKPYTCIHMHRCYDMQGKGQQNNERKSLPDAFRIDEKMNALARQHADITVDKPRLRSFVNTVKYPLWFFDIESFQPALPLYKVSRPFQQIPFQYSLHLLEDENATPVHYAFLASPDRHVDPRPSFAESLIARIGKTKGSIMVFDRTFEMLRLKELSADFPHYKPCLESMMASVVDLREPFRKRVIDSAALRESQSLKAITSLLFPESGYAGLSIKDGFAASRSYMNLVLNRGPVEKENIMNDLALYCEQDTYAMVRLFMFLQAAVQ
jgi:hypothetical protein